MAISITVPDLPTDKASFDDYFVSFNVQRQTDGDGGVVYMGTLSVRIKDAQGNDFKHASLTKELGPAAKSALRDFIKAQYLDALKAQEGV